MDRVALDQLFRDAAGAYRSDNEKPWAMFDDAVKADAVAVGEAAIPLVSSRDAAERVVAIWALRQACNVCGEIREPSFLALASRVGVEDDVDACRCLAQALGAVADARAVTPLVALALHADAGVREHVAGSLPTALLESIDQAGVDALLHLMTDDNDDVRDWATFGIGSQLNVDGLDIREALAARLGDTCDDAREEAMVGLARRRDRRALPAVIEALRSDPGPRLAFEAAEYLADPVLVPWLALHDRAEVDAALQRCDPQRRASWDERVAEFASVLQARLDIDFPGAAAVVGCELCETETWLRVEALTAGWCVDVLLEHDAPTYAADRVIQQLTDRARRHADSP
jgi:HEAT repeats